jgi:small-conductance mechanosensitive channel
MFKRLQHLAWSLFMIAMVLMTHHALGMAQPSPSSPPESADATTVVLDETPLFTITEARGAQSAQERATSIANQLETFARDPDLPVEGLMVGEQNGTTVIFYDATVVAVITEADAVAANTTPTELAASVVQSFRTAVAEYRQVYDLEPGGVRSTGSLWDRIVNVSKSIANLTTRDNVVNYPLAIAYTILATVLFGGLLFGLRRVFPQVYRMIRRSQQQRRFSLRLYRITLLSTKQVGRLLFFTTKLTQAIITGGVVLGYVLLVLSLYPLTRRFARTIFSYTQAALVQMGEAFLGYLPNIFIIVFIIIATGYSLRILKPIFKGLEEERIKISGFYSEWAEPTYRLVEIFILVMAGVLCFPYLPGFGSEAFQGLSLFLGVLVSLGSTTAIANAVSGVILIYTRAFRLGDYIRVGDIKGEVQDKSLLVTQLRTSNNVIVTIPNASLIANNIENYSLSNRDSNRPVILTTTITLGYDVPWALVYETLIAAARATNHVLSNPTPTVHQTGLGDFSVSYELRLCTDVPHLEIEIHSHLHQNIQDHCNAADIEILSPTYSAIRDGNTSTIPADYLPADYKADGFRLNPIGNLIQMDLQWGQARRNGRSPSSGNAQGQPKQTR